VADLLEHQRPQLQHRAAIIEAPPRCAPAQSGQAGHQQLISDQLAQRGLRREHARLVGALRLKMAGIVALGKLVGAEQIGWAIGQAAAGPCPTPGRIKVLQSVRDAPVRGEAQPAPRPWARRSPPRPEVGLGPRR